MKIELLTLLRVIRPDIVLADYMVRYIVYLELKLQHNRC